MGSRDRDFDCSNHFEPSYLADYFGLQVEVVVAMPNCSSIRYGHRELIVLTQDLRPIVCRQASAA
jgi:hypothetical protein